MSIDWDDPFGRAAREAADKQKLIIPNHAPPVDIAAIKAEQLKVADFLKIFHKAASDALRTKDGVQGLTSRQTVSVFITYRMPDQPHVLAELIQQIADHAVPLPARQQCPAKVLDDLFPIRMDHQGRVLRISDHEMSSVRVIYPATARYLLYWLTEMDGTLKKVSIGAARQTTYGKPKIAEYTLH